MSAMTAFELEAERRRELAMGGRRAPRPTLLEIRRDGPAASDRRLIFGWRLTSRLRPLEDARS